ncbi:high osmolarity sensitivity protein 3 [Lipomyces oligophaga]|uniref:high osmolarity sensitivity protein 3 n=1 Tax=Lipomyces oligophaga TaxID=45792 RepID=UPI0034CDB9C2
MYSNRSSISLSSTQSSQKPRQMSHLHSQLAQLQANLSDLDNLLAVTAVQAQHMRLLGGIHGSMFMAAGRVFEKSAVPSDQQLQSTSTLSSDSNSTH